MRRHSDGEVAWAEHPWETPDPDLVDDSLAKLTMRTDTALDAFWHLVYPIDGEELLNTREKQKIQLARYAKQSLLQWDDVEVTEIRRWYDHLAELVKGEHSITGGTED